MEKIKTKIVLAHSRKTKLKNSNKMDVVKIKICFSNTPSKLSMCSMIFRRDLPHKMN